MKLPYSNLFDMIIRNNKESKKQFALLKGRTGIYVLYHTVKQLSDIEKRMIRRFNPMTNCRHSKYERILK